MIAIIDYGVGNLYSLCSSLKVIGADIQVTSDAGQIHAASKIILPGVGAFGDAVQKLRDSGLYDVLVSASRDGKPVMGICLGMQLLFEKSYEYGEHEGLGLLRGEVIPMKETIPDNLMIPHIGWNRLHVKRDSRILANTKDGDHVYFVHSYYAVGCDESLVATTDYGAYMTAVVEKDNVCGCQFHPEKSGDVGLGILRAFCEL